MEIRAPAKINLFLQVVGRRDDGYHDLRTLMCCIGLYDSLVLRMGTACNEIICTDPKVPCDETNLALRAALLFNKALKTDTCLDPKKLSIHLTKRIPIGAGLGGGSSDAAAVLKYLNRYYERPFSRRQLHAMALTLGADVPFFIDQRPALATGVGERLEPCSFLRPWQAVVVYPGFGISTAEVFKNLNLGLTKCQKQLRYFLFNSGKFDAARHLCNDLETGVVDHFPVIAHIKKRLLNKGAIGSLMTGSGSAVFGLFAEHAAALKAADALGEQDGWQVYATRLLC